MAAARNFDRVDWSKGRRQHSTVPALAFIRDVIFQRDRDEEGDRMQKMTREIRTLTWWITGLTVVNTAAVITAVRLGR